MISGIELGRLHGEAPYEVTLHPDPDEPGDGWRFDFGDGTAETANATHRFEKPGHLPREGRARRPHDRRRGDVTEGLPPQVLHAEVLPGGLAISLLFDERIDVGRASARLGSGLEVASLRAGDRGRDLVVVLTHPLEASDELAVEGVSDRAGRPNVMTPARVPIVVASWPGSGNALVFAFDTAGHTLPVRDVDDGRVRTFSVIPHGRSRYDAFGALRVTDGWFEVEDLPRGFAAAFRESNAFTLEATVWPDLARAEDSARIVSLAVDERSQNLSLSQDGTEAVLRVRVTKDGRKDHATAEFGKLDPGVPNHILVTYRPGQLVAYQNGRQVLDTDAIQGDLSDWRDGVRLAFGADPVGGQRDFSGRVEGIALYTRFFEPDEAAAHSHAYLHAIGERKPVPRLVVNARLLSSSALPSPAQIVPYREALVVNEYEVPAKRRQEFGGDHVRVAHWAVLDGETQPVPQPGLVRLELEPWESHPRLEGTYVSDTLDPDPEVPLYVDVGGSPAPSLAERATGGNANADHGPAHSYRHLDRIPGEVDPLLRHVLRGTGVSTLEGVLARW